MRCKNNTQNRECYWHESARAARTLSRATKDYKRMRDTLKSAQKSARARTVIEYRKVSPSESPKPEPEQNK